MAAIEFRLRKKTFMYKVVLPFSIRILFFFSKFIDGFRNLCYAIEYLLCYLKKRNWKLKQKPANHFTKKSILQKDNGITVYA